MSLRITALLFASLLTASGSVLAGQDAPAVQARIDAARKLAGEQWSSTVDLFCATEQQVAAMKILPSANAGDDAAALRREPMKLFDNMYFVGTRTDANYVLSTPEGFIVIDSGRPQRLEDTFLAGFKALGLDPGRIRYVLIAHEHEDHFGGSTALQQRYPSLRVGMSAAAWDGVAKMEGAPKRDLVLEEGKPVTLGGFSVNPVAIPGHTAGSLGFIFEVKDNGRTHVAGVFGGTVLNPTARIPFDVYKKSIEHWQARGVDLSAVLRAPDVPEGTPLRRLRAQDSPLPGALDWQLIEASRDALDDRPPPSGRVEVRASIRSSNPPCPGNNAPLSLTLAWRLIADSNRSPITAKPTQHQAASSIGNISRCDK